MDHLREFIKGAIEYQKENFDVSSYDDEEIFEIVMENVVSLVEGYNYSDYTEGE